MNGQRVNIYDYGVIIRPHITSGAELCESINFTTAPFLPHKTTVTSIFVWQEAKLTIALFLYKGLSEPISKVSRLVVDFIVLLGVKRLYMKCCM